MSYELLRGLYLGQQSNADLTETGSRQRLHVRTALDGFIPEVINSGRDVVLTGNPGDGKSHLIRVLNDLAQLEGSVIELDLSARDSADVARQWAALRESGTPFVICANEGPLTGLIETLEGHPASAEVTAELRSQLGRLLVSRTEDLPPEPEHAVLINLADRNLLSEEMIRQALDRVCHEEYLPEGMYGLETSAGQNILLLTEPEVQDRLARLIAAAGRQLEEHVTFRQLWATISYAVTAGKAQSTLSSERSRDLVGLGTYPLDNLTAGRGRGTLIEAFRRFADPARIAAPQLEEDLWAEGSPRRGEWLGEEFYLEPPSELWASGKHEEALAQLASIKRLVALAHTEGEFLLEMLDGANPDLPLEHSEEALRAQVVAGIRRAYLSPTEDTEAPGWLTSGLPLWIGHTYQDVPAGDRPHVAAAWVDEADLSIRYPLRAPWLIQPMGEVQELAWLHHGPSGVSLRLEPRLLRALRVAATSSGPLEPPEPVQRFLARLAGWAERQPRQTDVRFAVLAHPRGALSVHGRVQDLDAGGAHYARS